MVDRVQAWIVVFRVVPADSRTARGLAAALCALVLAAAGCGATGYRDDLSSAESQFKKGTKASFAKMQASSTATRRVGIRQFRGTIQAFEGKLRTLKPPSSARALHNQLVTSLDAVSQDLESLLGILASGNLAQARALGVKYVRDLQTVQTTAKELHKKVD